MMECNGLQRSGSSAREEVDQTKHRKEMELCNLLYAFWGTDGNKFCFVLFLILETALNKDDQFWGSKHDLVL